MKAWHFVRQDRRLGYGDGREVKVGETLEMIVTDEARARSVRETSDSTKPTLCKSGMHGSKRLIDALGYAPGLMLCEVEISGDIVEGEDKIVGRTRKVLRMIDATQIAVRFAAICAQRAQEHAARYDAYAARYAARYAAANAADAAADATRYADADAAAAYAARYAARYAADAAAYAAADATRYADADADADATRYADADADADAEREEQEKIFLSLVEAEFA